MISVCIATYNGEKFIKEQLESILSQLSEYDEIVISDDSSNDNTVQIIQNFKDTRIKLHTHQIFRNPTLNFQNAINNSIGNIIFLADQDDVWYPNKVTTMIKYLSQYDLVVSDCHIGSSNLQILKESHFELRNSGKGVLKNIYKNSYLGCCMAFNRKILTKILPFPSYIPMFDTWIGIISDIYFNTYFIPEKLMIYRRHSNNVTKFTDDFKSVNYFGTKLKHRYLFIKALFKRILFNN